MARNRSPMSRLMGDRMEKRHIAGLLKGKRRTTKAEAARAAKDGISLPNFQAPGSGEEFDGPEGARFSPMDEVKNLFGGNGGSLDDTDEKNRDAAKSIVNTLIDPKNIDHFTDLAPDQVASYAVLRALDRKANNTSGIMSSFLDRFENALVSNRRLGRTRAEEIAIALGQRPEETDDGKLGKMMKRLTGK